jgi:hypothetical protein
MLKIKKNLSFFAIILFLVSISLFNILNYKIARAEAGPEGCPYSEGVCTIKGVSKKDCSLPYITGAVCCSKKTTCGTKETDPDPGEPEP